MATLRNTINKISLALFRVYVPEIGLLAASAALYLYNAIRYRFPTGYAGLYTLMTEQLAANSFRLPRTVPFYGPGGFPYAYPPAGFYLAALVTKIFDIASFTYLRFAPPLLTLFFLVLDYVLIQKMTGSRIKALAGASITACAGAVYEYHVQAAGMVRAPALVFAILALILSWDGLFSERPMPARYLRALLAGAALGLTVLSHLSYALFAVIGILVFFLFAAKTNWRSRALISATTFAAGILVSSIWWGTVLVRYGLTVLENPARSHGNFGVLGALVSAGLRSPIVLVQRLLPVTNDWIPSILVGLIVIGLSYTLLRRKWILPVWFLLVFLFVGEAKRFLVIIGCIAAADAIGSLLEWIHAQDQAQNRVNYLAYTLGLSFILVFSFYGGFRVIRSDAPTLTPALIDMAAWFQNNSPSDTHYLLLDGYNDLDEWIPYLTRRIPIVGNWGGEWVGNLSSLDDLNNQVNACITEQSYACLQEVIRRKNLQVPWLISLSKNAALNEQIGADSAWQLAYKNDQFVIFESKPDQ